MEEDDGTTQTVYYFINDHLSSASVVTDASGTLLSENRYTPFGEVRDLPASMSTDDPITETDFGYTGQRDLGGIGLMDYNARFYSPALGRFIQPDSIVPSAENPQSWNRFSYVKNNPINYFDPTGHCNEYMVSKKLCNASDDDFYWWTRDGEVGSGGGEEDSGADGNDQGGGGNPNRDLKTSEAGKQFIADEEGRMLCLYNDKDPYNCATGDPNDTAEIHGDCTIGYGHLVHYGPCEGIGNPLEDPAYVHGISEEEAWAILEEDLIIDEDAVKDQIAVPLTQNQFDALVSFSHNTGERGLTIWGIAEAINTGRIDKFADNMRLVINDRLGNRLEGLVNRRESEIQMFINGIYPP